MDDHLGRDIRHDDLYEELAPTTHCKFNKKNALSQAPALYFFGWDNHPFVWWFPRIVVQNGWFTIEHPIKIEDKMGYPHFRNPPYQLFGIRTNVWTYLDHLTDDQMKTAGFRKRIIYKIINRLLEEDQRL